MSNELYIRTHWTRMPSEHPRGYTDWAIAEIVLNGVVLFTRTMSNEGTYAAEGVAMRTAISMAKNDLSQWLDDIRATSNLVHPEVSQYGIPPGRTNGSTAATAHSAASRYRRGERI